MSRFEHCVGDPGRLSVIVPVFNEEGTILQLLARVQAVPIEKQIIVVDDRSSDGTDRVLREWGAVSQGTVVLHSHNLGKGRAIRTGLAVAAGEFTIIQDADLEYDPTDYHKILDALRSGEADVVLGSRYLKGPVPGVGRFFRLGVGVLNLAVRVLYGAWLTDEATCYKATRTEILRKMNLQCARFEFCPEMIAKACRMGLRIVEVPISYHPRTAKDGKKIRLRDGWVALLTLWRWRKWVPHESCAPNANCEERTADEEKREQVSAVGTDVSPRNQGIPSLPRPAFTLVELITVMGIITLLIGLLMPAMLRARQDADRVRCLATLRGIGQASQQHQADHRGYLPVAGWHFDPLKGSPGADATPAADAPKSIATPVGLHDSQEQRYIYYTDKDQKRPVPITVALAHYMQAEVRLDSRDTLVQALSSEHLSALFRCAAQTKKQELSGISQRDDKDGWIAPPEFSCYVFNEAVLGVRTLIDTGGGEPPVGNAVKIKRSSEVMLAADGRPRNQTTDNWLLVFNKSAQDTLYDFQQNLQQGGWGKESFDHDRHHGDMNVLFIDGHAETVHMSPGGLKMVGVSKGIYD